MSSIVDRLLAFPPWLALVLIFLLPAAEASVFLGIVFPGELAVLLGGVLANEHKVSLWSVLLLGSAGAIVGDSIGYEVGRHFGDRLLARLPRRLVKPEHIDRGRQMLRSKGGRAVFLGRFTAALRVLVPGLAGTSRLPYRSFLIFNVLGGVAWVAMTAVAGYAVGRNYRTVEHRLSFISLGLLVLVAAYFLYRAGRRSQHLRSWSRRRFEWLDHLNRQLAIWLAIWGVSTWLFVGLAQDVLDSNDAKLGDGRLQSEVLQHRTRVLTWFAKCVTQLGAGFVVYPLVAFLGYLLWRRTRRWKPLILALTWLSVGQLVRFGLSQAIARPRPSPRLWLVHASGFSFPSGHTAGATMGYALAAVLLVQLRPRSRFWIILGAGTLAVAVGVSRIYLGVHWPTDVLGGWSLGAAWVALGGASLLGIDLALGRRRAARSSAEFSPVP